MSHIKKERKRLFISNFAINFDMIAKKGLVALLCFVCLVSCDCYVALPLQCDCGVS